MLLAQAVAPSCNRWQQSLTTTPSKLRSWLQRLDSRQPAARPVFPAQGLGALCLSLYHDCQLPGAF